MTHPRRTLAAAFALAAMAFTAPAFADQPHMEAALKHLKEAKESLARASTDKGGHRAKAADAIDRAMSQVQAGIDFDKKNMNPAEKAKQAATKP
jgi:hypothetical protein